MSEFLYLFLICFLYLFSALSGMTLIKLGHESVSGLKIPLLGFMSFKVIIGMFLYATSFLIFVFFISKMKISVVVPIVSGLYCIFVMAIGILIFKEKITVWQMIGVVLISLGTVIVGVLKK